MNAADTSRPGEPPPRFSFFGLNRWLQLFLTIIAGTVVAIIVWTVLERFMHIIILLLGSFLLAYLLGPLVDRLARGGLSRLPAILLVYLVILGTLGVGVTLLVGPLTAQLQGLVTATPDLLTNPNKGIGAQPGTFFGIPVDVTNLVNKVTDYISGAATSLLGGALSVVAGLVAFVTDLFLGLAIAFYFLLDGRAMRNRGLRLLPANVREKWFFVEATLSKVVGGYIRGQLIVALTVGIAAGLGSAVLGVDYPLVIGLLAFLFEFIPMLGPVLGMVPAVIIALFQSPGLALWVIVYFIALQQVESNVIVPRVSGHAVGLHPLAALLALLAGFELGGVGGALLAVPVAGVLYVLALALYTDATGDSEMLITKPRQTAYVALRNVVSVRRGRSGASTLAPISTSTPTPAQAQASAITSSATPGVTLSAMPSTISGTTPTATPLTPEKAPHERLVTIAQDQAELMAEFDAEEAKQAAAEQQAVEVEDKEGNVTEVRPRGPDDVRAPSVP